MIIDPVIVIAAITALAGAILAVFRMFMTGAIHPRSTVPREDYDALFAVNASLVTQDVAKTEILRGMAESLKTFVTTVEKVAPTLNGVKK